MELLEKMLEVETEARQLLEQAKLDTNNIRQKAREDAQQLIIDGRKNLHERVQQEIAQLENDANARKAAILHKAKQRLAEMEARANVHMESAVEKVMQKLLDKRE